MQRHSLSDIEKRDWLRLSRTDNVGPITIRQLLRRFGSVKAALDALPARARHAGGKVFKIPEASAIEDETTLSTLRTKVPDNLSPSPVSIDELVRECKIRILVILTVLLELRLAGQVERQPGHKVVLIG